MLALRDVTAVDEDDLACHMGITHEAPPGPCPGAVGQSRADDPGNDRRDKGSLMFAGIVEKLGWGSAAVLKSGLARLSGHADALLGGVTCGASIAVNGVSLTGVQNAIDGVTVDVRPETSRGSSLGALQVGSAGATANLQRAVSATGRVGGRVGKALSSQWAR